ncbi:nitroreductase family protein [Planctomycetota bacterium]
MKTQKDRRSFLKTSGLLGGSMLLPSLSAQAETANNQSNDTLKTIGKLRTIHGNFTDQAISDEAIETILQASVRAANASNMQSYSIVVVKDRQKMKQVCQYQGACMFLYCADHTRLQASAEALGYAYHADNIQAFVTASINAGLAAQTAAIAARSLGIDYLITNGIHRGDMERVWTLLDLPKSSCFPLLAMVLGYPTQEPEHLKGRLTGVGVIHRESYHRPTTAELEKIRDQYDDKTLHLALNDKWDQQGFEHYQDFLHQRWLKRSAQPTQEETQMFRLLKRSGYVDLQKG